jgi:hypothetical protein
VAGTFVPLGMFIVPSVNPSSWSLIGVTTAAFALHSYWLAERRGLVIVNAVLAAVGVFLAAGSRADAALYSILAAVAVTCLHYRSVRRHPVRLVLPGAIVVGGGIAFRMASQAGSALAGGLGAPEPTGGWHLLLSNIINLPILIFGSGGIPGLGSLGQLDTPMPPIVWVSTLMVLAFLVMAGLQRLSWMKVLVTTAGILVVAAIPLYILQTSHLIVGEGVQPRYVLPLLPVVALVLLTGSRPDHAVRLTVASSWVAWALLSVANSVALLFNIQRYTTGVLGPLFPGHTVAWWSTSRMPPLPTWILGSLGFAIAARMIVRLSMGSDAPIPPAVVAGQGQEALEPSPPSADVSVLASAPAVADTQTTPTEPATTDSTLVEPATEDPVAAPATPQWTSGPASR